MRFKIKHQRAPGAPMRDELWLEFPSKEVLAQLIAQLAHHLAQMNSTSVGPIVCGELFIDPIDKMQRTDK